MSTIINGTTNAITFPDGTIQSTAANTGPAFSAYLSTAAVLTGSAAWTKVILNSEEFDTANCFDSTTNYRFTPNVAGYYQVNAGVSNTSGANTQYISIYKNGSAFKAGNSALSVNTSVASALIYLNGSTDYIELYSYNTPQTYYVSGASATFFQAFLARTT